MLKMSHRLRVATALNHEEPDAVPLDLGTGGNTSPVPEVYERLTHLLQYPYELKPVPHIMRLATVDERILQYLDIDTRPIYMHPSQIGLRQCSEADHFYDEWGVKWREYNLGGVIYRELAESPLQDATLDDLERYPWWPDPFDLTRYAGLETYAQKMFTQTDYALVGCPAFNSLWERAYYLCGFQRMLEGLLTEPEFVHALFRKITDLIKQSLGIYLARVGKVIQVVKMGDDLGAQDNSLISPRIYRQTIQPYHRELFQFIHTQSPARVFLHSCGSVYNLLPDLIDAGVDILNPVQVSAKNMDSPRLKNDFGDRLSFWGAIDTQHVLPHGSTGDVTAEVQRRIADLAPGGGYILASVHNLQADVPAENIVTMYQTARIYGQYPLQAAAS
ncbi:MAG TPA: uroporphyrinogen decarboxylase family protein [Anaerolineales bacterium]|nr:uroporphyrinogen decarboxylase family protein [Anaerolineales bacterium]